MITPIIINRLKWKAYLIFMATNLVFIPIIYFFYPETSNLALEEVDYIFARGENAVEVAREMQKELAREGRLDVERSLGGKTEPSAFVDGTEKQAETVEHVSP
jgi:hypothetical protein